MQPTSTPVAAGLSSASTGAAKRKRDQRARQLARHVHWLVSLSQASASHHTSVGGGLDLQRTITELRHDLANLRSAYDKLQEEFTSLSRQFATTVGTAKATLESVTPKHATEHSQAQAPLATHPATAVMRDAAVTIDGAASAQRGDLRKEQQSSRRCHSGAGGPDLEADLQDSDAGHLPCVYVQKRAARPAQPADQLQRVTQEIDAISALEEPPNPAVKARLHYLLGQEDELQSQVLRSQNSR